MGYISAVCFRSCFSCSQIHWKQNDIWWICGRLEPLKHFTLPHTKESKWNIIIDTDLLEKKTIAKKSATLRQFKSFRCERHWICVKMKRNLWFNIFSLLLQRTDKNCDIWLTINCNVLNSVRDILDIFLVFFNESITDEGDARDWRLLFCLKAAEQRVLNAEQ